MCRCEVNGSSNRLLNPLSGMPDLPCRNAGAAPACDRVDAVY
jgi:hypothetical protein